MARALKQHPNPGAREVAMSSPISKVAVCVPSADLIHARCWLSLLSLSAPAIELGFLNWRSCYVTEARNALVGMAKEWGADWLLFLDSDMTFPPDTLFRLLAWNKDIVGGTYVKRVPPHEIICAADIVDPETAKTVGNGLIEMKAMPTGCLLIRMSVFEKFKRPYFRMSYVDESPENPDGKEIGEDINFCREARLKGFRIWCDVGLSRDLGHLGVQEFKIQKPESQP